MKVHMQHRNGNEWLAAEKVLNGVTCFVLSNKNPLKHKDKKDGTDEHGNEERFHLHVPDVRSVINGLQFGLSIRMTGIGDNGKKQTNLFTRDEILIDGAPVMSVFT